MVALRPHLPMESSGQARFCACNSSHALWQSESSYEMRSGKSRDMRVTQRFWVVPGQQDRDLGPKPGLRQFGRQRAESRKRFRLFAFRTDSMCF